MCIALATMSIAFVPTDAQASAHRGSGMTLEVTPTTVAPGGTIAITGQCSGQWANIHAGLTPDEPGESYDLHVQYLVRADGSFGGGFVLPSDAPTGTGEIVASCQSGDALYGYSERIALTVTGDSSGAFAIELAVTPTTVARGEPVQVSGRCINNGIPTSTARVWAIGPWFEFFHAFTDYPVNADGTFSGELSFPIDFYDLWHVYADCRTGDDVVALYSNGFESWWKTWSRPTRPTHPPKRVPLRRPRRLGPCRPSRADWP